MYRNMIYIILTYSFLGPGYFMSKMSYYNHCARLFEGFPTASGSMECKIVTVTPGPDRPNNLDKLTSCETAQQVAGGG